MSSKMPVMKESSPRFLNIGKLFPGQGCENLVVDADALLSHRSKTGQRKRQPGTSHTQQLFQIRRTLEPWRSCGDRACFIQRPAKRYTEVK